MKLLISLCVFSVLLVLIYGYPKKFVLLNAFEGVQEDCNVLHRRGSKEAKLCINYGFGFLQDDINGRPIFDFLRYIEFSVELSVFQHYRNPKMPIATRLELIRCTRPCRIIRGKDALTLLDDVQKCANKRCTPVREFPEDIDFDSSSSEELSEEF